MCWLRQGQIGLEFKKYTSGKWWRAIRTEVTPLHMTYNMHRTKYTLSTSCLTHVNSCHGHTHMMSTYIQDTQQACTHHTHVHLLHTYVCMYSMRMVEQWPHTRAISTYACLHSPERLRTYVSSVWDGPRWFPLARITHNFNHTFN